MTDRAVQLVTLVLEGNRAVAATLQQAKMRHFASLGKPRGVVEVDCGQDVLYVRKIN